MERRETGEAARVLVEGSCRLLGPVVWSVPSSHPQPGTLPGR